VTYRPRSRGRCGEQLGLGDVDDAITAHRFAVHPKQLHDVVAVGLAAAGFTELDAAGEAAPRLVGSMRFEGAAAAFTDRAPLPKAEVVSSNLAGSAKISTTCQVGARDRTLQ
jgi:hypothetical protein